MMDLCEHSRQLRVRAKKNLATCLQGPFNSAEGYHLSPHWYAQELLACLFGYPDYMKFSGATEEGKHLDKLALLAGPNTLAVFLVMWKQRYE